MKKIYFLSLLLLTIHSIKAGAQLTGRWYSYTDYVYNNAAATDITVLNMWNDTTAKFGYSGTTPTYSRSNMVSAGTTFAPRLAAWDDVSSYGSTFKVGPTDVFYIDSIRVLGTYLRNNLKPTIKDTLRFALTYGNGAIPTNLPGFYFPPGYLPGYIDTVRFLTMYHDSIKNIAGRYDGTTPAPYIQNVILSNTDTATFFNKSYALTTPLMVPAGQVAASSLTFKSGDAAYTAGDTITYVSGGRKYGLFQPYLLYNSDGAGNPFFATYNPLDSNVGLFKRIPSPYWEPYYIPTWAWTSSGSSASVLQYPAIDFHITCPTCRLNDTITGTTVLCASTTTTLAHSLPGGSWSTSSGAIATVSGAGIVMGVSAGTANITYSVSGHITVRTVTVTMTPVGGTLSGASSVCAGATTTLTPSMAGGTWSSSAPGIATVSGGVVTGVSGGTTTISYTLTTACGTGYATRVMTVNPLPSAGTLSGGAAICAGTTLTLSSTVSGGTWTSSGSAAFVSGSGVVTGVSTGTAVITYTKTNSCGSSYATYTATVDAAPPVAGSLSGGAAICAGTTMTLTSSLPGGTWSSSGAGIATVSAGVVTGVAGGTATITYTITNGCGSASTTYVATINPLPDAGTISGSATICIGTATTMTETATGGTWSMTSGKAIISSSGIATGLTAGADVVVYTCANSCGTTTALLPVTVVAQPDAGTISGLDATCVGGNIVLTTSASGGSWSASNGNATVSGGTVTGVTAGTVTITYAVTNDCGTATAQKVVTVNDCPTEVGSVNNGSGISIFPNPVTSILTIISSSTIEHVVVTNVVGQKVYSEKCNSNKVAVDMSQLPAGVYTIRVNESNVYKVTKE